MPRFNDGKMVVGPGQTVTLDGVTLDNVILLDGTDDLDGTTSTVSSDSTIDSPRFRTAR